MKKLNKICVLDKKAYHYCSSGCKDSIGKPAWMMSFCSENCKNIFEAVSLFNTGKLTAYEARNILDQCDLSSKDHFTESTQKIIDDIYWKTVKDQISATLVNVEPETEQEVKEIIKPAIEVELEEIDNEPEVAEPVVVHTYDYKKKKKMKKNNG